MNNRTLAISLRATLIAMALPFAVSAFAQSAAPEPNDDAIVTAVKSALAAKPQLKAGGLKVTSKKGEVTIAGKVDDGHQLYNIAETAQRVPGVKTVNNEMMPAK
jgi:osmotically-inducible protein OsmY